MPDLVVLHPLFGLVLTVAAYLLAVALWTRAGKAALLHPVLVASALVVVVLVALGLSYQLYLQQAFLLNEGLGAVIVLLAVPLCRQFPAIRAAGAPIAVSLMAGSAVAIAGALALPAIAGGEAAVIATLAPKSATAAVAVEVSELLGGAPGLTAVIVISTGIFGAAFGPAILRTSGVHDPRAVGFALGLASHAIGTARAFQMCEVTGAFASLGMILNALLTIALAPIALALLGV